MRTLLALSALLLFAAPAVAAIDEFPQRELLVGSSLRSVEATAGPGCYAYTQGQEAGSSPPPCDYGGPLPLKRHLSVRRGHIVALDFDRPVVQLDVRITDYDREAPSGDGPVGEPYDRIPAEPAGGATPERRWIFRVPDHWADGPVRLHAFPRYGWWADRAHGDGNFEFGLHVLRRGSGRVTVPRVAGLPLGRALRELVRRGLGWRLDGEREIHFDPGPPPRPDAERTGTRRRVVSQDLRPGRRVRRNTVIDLKTRR